MRSLPILLFTAVSLIPVTAHAGVVFTDNFNNENGGTPVLGTTTLTNFNVTLPSVDVIGSSVGGTSYDFYPGNGLYLDLDGTSGATNSQISTRTVFGPGSYNLSFLLGNNPGGGGSINTVTISLGDYTSGAINTTGFPALTQYNLAFTTSVSGALTFTQGGPADQQGTILDNVQLSSVPEPGSVVTMLSGLAGLGLIQWKRRRNS